MNSPPVIPPEAMLCALVLAPQTFTRNKFFELFEQPTLKKSRRRAKRLRGIIRQLLGQGREPAEIVGRYELADGSVLLKYQVLRLNYVRTTSLSMLEASLVNYAIHRAGAGPLDEEDKIAVEQALAGLGANLELGNTHRPPPA